MYEITVQNACRCFLKDGLPERQTFKDKDAAKREAESLLAHMQKHFCKKHTFSMLPTGTGFKLLISES
jgi:hypothetical protein